MKKSKGDIMKKNPLSEVAKVIHLHECSSLKMLHRRKIIIESWTEGRV